MFVSNQKPTGTEYTTTVAFLVLAFLFSPALLLLSGPLGYVSLTLAVACSVLCVSLAWLNWRKYSKLTIPSLETGRAKSK